MKCPNCGAEIPAEDFFCGECGTRVVPEEKPSPPPPDAPPSSEEASRRPPRGLLIGCGGLLALVIIAACIWGAVTLLDGQEPTATPTQVVQKPTNTPTFVATATNTPVPAATPEPTGTPTPSPASILGGGVLPFELVTFALDVTEDDQPIDPGTAFPGGTTQVYAVFEFSGMQDGMTYEAYWYLDGEEEVHESWEWSVGEQGRSWVNIFNDDGLTPGGYELELYVGDQLVLNGEFTIQAGFAGTVSSVRFALAESDDDQPLGIGDVFPYGISEVYAFFDYDGFDSVTEIESAWLRDDQVDTSGTLEWTGQDSGTYRIRFFDDEPLVAGDYEWQLRIAGEDVVSGSFRIEEAQPGRTAYANPDLGFWLLYPSGWDVEEEEGGATMLSDQPGEDGVLVAAEELGTPVTAEEKALETLDDLQVDYPDLELLYSDTGLMDGEMATVLGAAFTDEDGVAKGLLIVQVNHGSWTYALLGMSDVGIIDAFGEIVGEMADSFHFLGETGGFSAALLFDGFSDPTSGWAEESDSERVQGYRDGTYLIRVTANDWIVWDTPGYNFDDFVLQVDVVQSAGDKENAYGLIFRYVDGDNFYRFGIDGDGYYSLVKQEEGEWVTIVDWRESAFLNLVGELNRLKVACQGPQITLYANDQELLSVTDDAFDQGDVGLFAAAYDVAEVEAVFDDFWVTENP